MPFRKQHSSLLTAPLRLPNPFLTARSFKKLNVYKGPNGLTAKSPWDAPAARGSRRSPRHSFGAKAGQSAHFKCRAQVPGLRRIATEQIKFKVTLC